MDSSSAAWKLLGFLLIASIGFLWALFVLVMRFKHRYQKQNPWNVGSLEFWGYNVILLAGLGAMALLLFVGIATLLQSHEKRAVGLTLSSTRTPPALPSALFQLSASSAPLSASVQAGPVSFIR